MSFDKWHEACAELGLHFGLRLLGVVLGLRLGLASLLSRLADVFSPP